MNESDWLGLGKPVGTANTRDIQSDVSVNGKSTLVLKVIWLLKTVWKIAFAIFLERFVGPAVAYGFNDSAFIGYCVNLSHSNTVSTT